MSKFASSFLLLLFAALAAVFGFDLDRPLEEVAATDRAVVTQVIDGDTVEILAGRSTEKVRFIGIDTPEVGECFFEESKEFLIDLVEHKEVVIESDPTQDNRDRYDRLLRYVYLPEGVNIGEELVRLGYAHEYTYRKAYKHQDLFKEAESLANAQELGLHQVCNK